jgi:hypothetical protein
MEKARESCGENARGFARGGPDWGERSDEMSTLSVDERAVVAPGMPPILAPYLVSPHSQQRPGGVVDEQFPIPDVSGEHGVAGVACRLPNAPC